MPTRRQRRQEGDHERDRRQHLVAGAAAQPEDALQREDGQREDRPRRPLARAVVASGSRGRRAARPGRRSRARLEVDVLERPPARPEPAEAEPRSATASRTASCTPVLGAEEQHAVLAVDREAAALEQRRQLVRPRVDLDDQPGRAPAERPRASPRARPRRRRRSRPRRRSARPPRGGATRRRCPCRTRCRSAGSARASPSAASGRARRSARRAGRARDRGRSRRRASPAGAARSTSSRPGGSAPRRGRPARARRSRAARPRGAGAGASRARWRTRSAAEQLGGQVVVLGRVADARPHLDARLSPDPGRARSARRHRGRGARARAR